MPKLGATMAGATILQWYKREGEPVEKGEPILEVMTDKINIDVEADASGILLKQLYEAATEVPVSTVLAYIGKLGEVVGDQTPTAVTVSSSSTASRSNEKATVHVPDMFLNPGALVDRPRATPSARRLARQHGVDLRVLQGTGPNNRIQKMDVERYISSRTNTNEGTSPVSSVDKTNIPVATAVGIERSEESTTIQIPRESNRIPVSGIRKVIGERMASSAFSAPHVTLNSEVNLAETVALRNRLLPVVESQSEQRLSFTEILILAVARTLRRNPSLNASYQGDYIEIYEDIHVGMAVAVTNGLVVPVIRHADRKGLMEIVQECKSLAKAARENRLKFDQLSGGTFTVSNLGMYRVDAFTPIINVGETAILGIGRIQEKPVVVGGAIEVKPMMTLSLSFDHRVIDGAPAAQFLTDLCNTLEHPEQLIL